jgi:hypothetical protein
VGFDSVNHNWYYHLCKKQIKKKIFAGMLGKVLQATIRHIRMKLKTILFPLLLLTVLSVSATMEDVQQAFKDKNYKQVFKLIQPYAESGNVVAQYNLAMMYAKGDGTDVDDKKAVHWYIKAAENGHIKAQNNLGLRYHRGNGVAADEHKSLYWFIKASKKGHLPSVFNIALMHSEQVKEMLKAEADRQSKSE